MPDRAEVWKIRKHPETPRPNDWRNEYYRDMARIIHGGAFRRLQGKTQVMGAGEGDVHRTRLTHSLEVHQIGRSLFHGKFEANQSLPVDIKPFLVDAGDVISAACYAHDLGHPPFGHGGERALHKIMAAHGGFEGNAQTIRILTKLEKYTHGQGINPTRRTLLAVLKYPVCYSAYPEQESPTKPPKCYYAEEQEIIDWVLEPFSESDRQRFTSLSQDNKPKYKALDASIMECADDIAYSTHDLEDSVARNFLTEKQVLESVHGFFTENGNITIGDHSLTHTDFEKLFSSSVDRKKFIGKLVNIMMTTTYIAENVEFAHPLLRYNLKIHHEILRLIEFVKKELTHKAVVQLPEVQMLERKGQYIVNKIYRELLEDPSQLIQHWHENIPLPRERKVCDHVAGMTDNYAAKIFHRMFTPGQGASTDEI